MAPTTTATITILFAFISFSPCPRLLQSLIVISCRCHPTTIALPFQSAGPAMRRPPATKTSVSRKWFAATLVQFLPRENRCESRRDLARDESNAQATPGCGHVYGAFLPAQALTRDSLAAALEQSPDCEP